MGKWIPCVLVRLRPSSHQVGPLRWYRTRLSLPSRWRNGWPFSTRPMSIVSDEELGNRIITLRNAPSGRHVPAKMQRGVDAKRGTSISVADRMAKTGAGDQS